MNQRSARFSIGQVIRHNLYAYRGVIVDIDPEYQGDEACYARMARTRPPKDRPWYQVLVHESDSEAYVAERNLKPDDTSEPVTHPRLNVYFHSFLDGQYRSRSSLH
ncbi:MAG: heat shock protein HspQ [Magnetococcales bacterium]|nr:heat shock protein HspQ [Magnetococcales bacterium]